MVTTILLTINILLLLLAISFGVYAFYKVRGWCAWLAKQDSEILDKQTENAEAMEDIQEKMENHKKRLASLEEGLVPDHEAAKKATEEVNKFMSGVGNIFAYDPFDALAQQRKEAGEGK